MKRRVAAAVGILVLSTSWVGAEVWEDTLRAEIDSQKSEWNAGYEKDGDDLRLEETGQYFFKTLDQGQTWEQPVELEANHDYVIMAVCGSECYDIDLYAYDGEGEILDEDTYEDAVPVVEFVATDGEQYVEVEMLDCGVNLCYAAIGVFEKTRE